MQTVSIVALALAFAVLPARAVVRLRRRGRADLAPWSRVALAALAAAVLLAALLGLDDAADTLLAAHMLQHVLIGDLAPLLLVLAVRGPVCVRLFPVSMVRLARRTGVARLLAAGTRPAPAFAVWAAALAVWHVPALYDGALENERLHAFEHLTFIAAGVLVWSVLLDPARRQLLAGWQRFGYALALLAASSVLGNVLVLSYRPLYPAYAEPDAVLRLSPVLDQDLAGLVMMVEQLATLGTFALVVARRRLAAPQAAQPARHPLAA
ncbi:MAG TPA: cytochrome c oxidase assembly protein [Gaiellaceae bacterium]|jgi:cytochrome c oxidase assembly factor CtaG